jgi:hypothetical protein
MPGNRVKPADPNFKPGCRQRRYGNVFVRNRFDQRELGSCDFLFKVNDPAPGMPDSATTSVLPDSAPPATNNERLAVLFGLTFIGGLITFRRRQADA